MEYQAKSMTLTVQSKPPNKIIYTMAETNSCMTYTYVIPGQFPIVKTITDILEIGKSYTIKSIKIRKTWVWNVATPFLTRDQKRTIVKTEVDKQVALLNKSVGVTFIDWSDAVKRGLTQSLDLQ